MSELYYKMEFKLKGETIFFPVYIQELAMSSDLFKERLGIEGKSSLAHETKKGIILFLSKNTWDQAFLRMAEMLKNPKEFEKLKKEIMGSYDELEKYMEKISTLSNENPLELYKEHVDVLSRLTV